MLLSVHLLTFLSSVHFQSFIYLFFFFVLLLKWVYIFMQTLNVEIPAKNKNSLQTNFDGLG